MSGTKLRMLENAYAQLSEVPQLARLNLESLIKLDKARRQQCTNDKNCPCLNANSIVGQLTGIVLENRWLFRTKEVVHRERERIEEDPPTIIEPDSE